jgi:hypothetical protein
MRNINILIIGISFLFGSAFQLTAQNEEVEKKSPDFTFSVKKLSDGTFELKSRLSLYENRIDIPVPAAEIDFAIGSEIKIEGNKTDKDGYAYAFIQPGVFLPRDKEGVITAIAEFAGNDLYEAASAEFIFTETKIVLSCELDDTIKTAKVAVFKIENDGKETPIPDESLIVSVQRMFSRLPVGDVSLDEKGKGMIEFPNDLPGDSLGNLQVIAYFNEHEIFGNSEAAAIAPWGIPKQRVHVTHRALWTQIAPLWMIVSLTVLLVGVWAHYFYVIAQLILIRIKGKKPIID